MVKKLDPYSEVIFYPIYPILKAGESGGKVNQKVKQKPGGNRDNIYFCFVKALFAELEFVELCMHLPWLSNWYKCVMHMFS